MEIGCKKKFEKKTLKNISRTTHHRDNLDRREYLRMDMNENLDGLPDEFVKSILSEINGDFLSVYPNYERLAEKIAEANSLEYENILVTNGSDGAINWIYEAFIEKDDKLLLTDPTFAMYGVYSRIYGANVVNVKYNDDLSFPYDEFINHLTPDIKLAVVVNPNNPCGTVVEEDKLENIIEIAKENNILLIIDEAYFYFYPHSMKDYIKKYDNLIILRTFSKMCAMAGLRAGYVMTDKDIIFELKKVSLSFDVNSVALLFAEKLLDNPHIISEMQEKVNAGKKYLKNEMDRLNVPCIIGEGCSALLSLGDDLDGIQNYFKQHKILVAKALNKYIRVSIGSPEKMKRFVDIVHKYRED